MEKTNDKQSDAKAKPAGPKLLAVKFHQPILVGNKQEQSIANGTGEHKLYALTLDRPSRTVVVTRVTDDGGLDMTEVPFESVAYWRFEKMAP